ncbi:MAG: hypothetical protein ACJ77Z_20875 [Thermoleophilaceae bacterium]
MATGVDHLQQYYGNNYSTVPTIGTLFFLNFVFSGRHAAGLIVPVKRVAGRYAEAVRAAFAVSGIGLAALSLAALFISEGSGLFGFVEHGYRTAIVLAIVAEVAAIVFLLMSCSSSCSGRPTSQSASRTRNPSSSGSRVTRNRR